MNEDGGEAAVAVAVAGGEDSGSGSVDGPTFQVIVLVSYYYYYYYTYRLPHTPYAHACPEHIAPSAKLLRILHPQVLDIITLYIIHRLITKLSCTNLRQSVSYQKA